MQNHYNLIYREEECVMIPLCQAENIAIIPWSPLARGLLAGTGKSPADTKATILAETDDFVRKLYDQPSDQDVIDAVRVVAQARRRRPRWRWRGCCRNPRSRRRSSARAR